MRADVTRPLDGASAGARPPAGVLFRGLVVVVVAGATFVLGGSGPRPVAAQSPAQGTVPAPPSVPPIPIPEIAQRAVGVAALLRQGAEQLVPSPEVQAIERELPAVGEEIVRRQIRTMQVLASSPSPIALAMLTDFWRVTRSELAAQNSILTKHATQLERHLEQIEAMRLTWVVSREAAVASEAPAPVLERIGATLTALASARQSVGEQRAQVLSLQDRVVREIGRCDDALARIAQGLTPLAGPPYSRDSLPIWSSQMRPPISADLGQRLRESLADNLALTRQYLAGQLARVPFQIALFLLVLVLARRARARARRRAEQEPSEEVADQIFELPLSSALVVALLSTIWIYPQAPRVLTNAVAVAILLPAVLIVRRLAPPPMLTAVYALAAFFLIEQVREICSILPVLERWVFLLQMVFGIGFLALAVRSEKLVIAACGREALGWRQALTWLLWGQLAVLASALLLGALGYMRLARLLGGTVLASSYVALALYATAPVAEGLAAYVLHTRLLRQLFIVERHRELLQRRTHLALRWVSVLLWVYLTLERVGLMNPLWSAAATVLDARYVRGSVSISLGDVVMLGMTILAAFLLSSFVRFVLQEDVYPRVGLSRGASYAASGLIHYAVVVVGVLVAVAALGVDLTRITILAGAFGVGIGIGLQGVVANFVSGLILLLEGRIHVGDSVQMGDLQGEVREIGGRASTIRTWDGAEVIVPNGRLTSENVTNWTLSDRMYRIDVQVGSPYSSDPERVLEILREVGTAHPKVLAEPAPLALCTGFGDSALNFELRVWTARFEEALMIRSELAVHVHAALTAASIAIPVPQRDIRIRNADPWMPVVASPASEQSRT